MKELQVFCKKKMLCIKEYKNPQTKLCFNKGSATLCEQPSLPDPSPDPQKRRFGGKTPLYTRLRVETDEDSPTVNQGSCLNSHIGKDA